jgi:hypothetical protein
MVFAVVHNGGPVFSQSMSACRVLAWKLLFSPRKTVGKVDMGLLEPKKASAYQRFVTALPHVMTLTLTEQRQGHNRN